MAPKKKKGDGEGGGGKAKSSKLTRMNEMDRVKYLERRMAEEEEGRKRKEEMVAGYLGLKLKHEERSVTVNKAKITEQWRSILRRAKTVDLRRDVGTLKDAFQRALEKKTTFIDGLLLEIEQSEEQYSMVFRAEMESVEHMVNIQEQRLTGLLAAFNQQKENLLQTSRRDKDEMKLTQQSDEAYLNDIQIALEQKHSELETILRSEFQSRKDEVRNRNLEELTTLKNSMEETMDSLWSQLRHQIKNYRDSTADKRRTYTDLLQKDKKGVMELQNNNIKIQKLQNEISQLRRSVNDEGTDPLDETSQLRKEKETCTTQLHQLRHSVSVLSRNKEHQKLRRLAVESDEILSELKMLKTEQEHLMKLHKMTQRLATQQDIALTLTNPLEKYLTQDEKTELADIEEKIWDPTLEIPVKLRNLEPIWRKLNKAELDYTAIQRENRSLELENKNLKSYLRNYIDLASIQVQLCSSHLSVLLQKFGIVFPFL
ncbi:coiled-coil domain-containing protein 65 [Eurytemora carolleeae]|uniref:coiled-coil domain-containing protein 65 n=1 Tax=Eurytemora carolleeae TaxID=1294199 RepID=UPI000C78EDCA|nr:coiled-coil domain-containing protein 65 [Eurytemora carolleeae]|eukprot:XP_023320041.1 coiled-coil domain-containing protein 65-like [Eurytemora affinis]